MRSSLLFFMLAVYFVDTTNGVLPPYQPVFHQDSDARTLIRQYFELGYTYKEIAMSLLVSHNISYSLRHLKRIIKGMGLRRIHANNMLSPIRDVITYLLLENEGSGKCLGYKTMWRRLKFKHKLKVKRDTVLELMWLVDPDAMEMRKAHRLMRRQYSASGPNYIWHIDGYDKLKPFGFCIHGAIDGYSRKILWLEVGKSNNNPKIIARYYLEALQQLKIAPHILRYDLGTEHATLKLIQPYFRFNCDDAFAGINSIMFGKSTSNQRIEAWWSILRRQNADWWISFFKDMRDQGLFCDANPLHLECIRFCFMPLIRRELHQVATEWNLHFIRAKPNVESPSGKPDFIYHNPEVYATRNYGIGIEPTDIIACAEVHEIDYNTGDCSDEFIEIVNILKPNFAVPENASDARTLYIELIQSLGII